VSEQVILFLNPVNTSYALSVLDSVGSQEKHANVIKKMGEELDVLDLMVMSKYLNMSFMLCADNQNHNTLNPTSILDYLKDFGVDMSSELAPEDSPAGVLILCSSSFGGQGINHFVPAWFAEELGDDDFEKVRYRSLARYEKTMERLKRDQKRHSAKLRVEKQTHGDASDSASLAQLMLTSLEDEWLRETQWREFEIKCHASGLHPVDVPGDGNCLLWSIKCLYENDIYGSKIDPESKKDMAVIKEWRKQTVKAWNERKGIPCWQLLYEKMYVDSDEQMKIHQPSSVSQGAHELVKAEVEGSKEQGCGTPPNKQGQDLGNVDAPTSHGSDGAQQPNPKRIARARVAPGFGDSGKEMDDASNFCQPGPSKPTVKKNASKTKQQKKQSKCSKQDSAAGNDDIEDSHQKQEGDDSEIDIDVAENLAKDTVQENGPAQKRRRVARRKQKGDREVQLLALRKYLAHKGITYPAWMTAHWRPDLMGFRGFPLHCFFCILLLCVQLEKQSKHAGG
jgi:hypothetical protein